MRICVTFNENESIIFPDGLRAAEIEMVRGWTDGRLGTRQDWFDAIASEDLDGLKALLLILRKRKNDTTSKFAEIDFNFDTLEAYFVDDDGKQIEPDVELDDDGDPVMTTAKPGIPPRPKCHKNDDGSDRWVYTDTRAPVPTGRPTRAKSKPVPAT